MQKRYFALALALVVLLTLLAVLGFRIEVSPAISLAEEEKEVYLTFDDGPSTVVTGRVLDVLKQENVKATFFVVGDRVKNREGTLRRIVAEGHTVGVHSNTHVYSEIYASDEALLKDIAACENIVARVTGVKPNVYRFPGGGCGQDTARRSALIRKMGYTIVRWNAVCGDEEIPHATAGMLLAETKKTSSGKRKVILLLHDSAPHAATAEALPAIIGLFREQGYVFRAF